MLFTLEEVRTAVRSMLFSNQVKEKWIRQCQGQVDAFDFAALKGTQRLSTLTVREQKLRKLFFSNGAKTGIESGISIVQLLIQQHAERVLDSLLESPCPTELFPSSRPPCLRASVVNPEPRTKNHEPGTHR